MFIHHDNESNNLTSTKNQEKSTNKETTVTRSEVVSTEKKFNQKEEPNPVNLYVTGGTVISVKYNNDSDCYHVIASIASDKIGLISLETGLRTEFGINPHEFGGHGKLLKLPISVLIDEIIDNFDYVTSVSVITEMNIDIINKITKKIR